MAISSKPFGPTVLSDEDAVQFKRQVAAGPSPRAVGLIARMQVVDYSNRPIPDAQRPPARVAAKADG